MTVVGETPGEAAVGALEERRTSPVELLWDLVFVFCVTQVTTLLSGRLTWAGAGRAMLVLALVWWAWSAFVWATNAQAAGSWTVSAVLLPSTAFIFIAAIALPEAFGGEATLFAAAYAAVRLLHLVLYADASRRGTASWSAIAGFAVTVVIGMALLLVGSLFPGAVRLALWGAAMVIDYAGPLLTRSRLRALQEVAVAHFAERYGLFVIIALGESIVAIGARTRMDVHHLTAGVIGSAALCLLITVGLWWSYFGRFAGAAESRLRAHTEPVLAASDAYSYLQLVVIAGIIIFAVGARLVIAGGGSGLGDSGRLALCGGVALYLGGLVLVRWRLLGSTPLMKVAAAIVLAAVGFFATGLPGWVAALVVALVLAVVSGGELEVR
jgi:low temperature requirement protein LtrA